MLQKLEVGGGGPEHHSAGGQLRRVSFGLLTRSRELLAAPGSPWRLSMCPSPRAKLPPPHLVLWGKGLTGRWPSGPKCENHSSLAQVGRAQLWNLTEGRHLASRGCMARPTAHTLPGNQAMSRCLGPEACPYSFCAVRKPPWGHACAQRPRGRSL